MAKPSRKRRSTVTLADSAPRKRPSLQYSIPCDAVQREQDGRAYIINPFDTMNRIGDAPVPHQFVILNCWTSGVGHWREHVTVSAPGGELLLETNEVEFWLRSSFNRHQVQNFVVVPLTEPGLHTVRVYLDHEEVLEYRLKFDIIQAPNRVS